MMTSSSGGLAKGQQPVVPEERRCTATTRAGSRCSNAAIRGGTVCSAHGGRAPQVRRAAQRRLVEQEVAKQLADHGVDRIADPIEAFTKLVEEAVALKEFFGGRVAALQDMRYESELGTEQLRAEVALYERAVDRAGGLLAKWLQLGLRERQVAITEEQSRLIVLVIRGTLVDLGVDVGDDQVRAVVTDHLKSVSGGATSPRRPAAASALQRGRPTPPPPPAPANAAPDPEEGEPVAAEATPPPPAVVAEPVPPAPPIGPGTRGLCGRCGLVLWDPHRDPQAHDPELCDRTRVATERRFDELDRPEPFGRRGF